MIACSGLVITDVIFRPMLKYQSYFYTFQELGEAPSAAAIRRACKDTHRRQIAFKNFQERFPTDVTYAFGYVSSFAKNGLYSEADCDQCLSGIDAALRLKDSRGTHAKLNKLKLDVERQRMEWLKQPAGESSSDGNSIWTQFRAGNYEPVQLRFRELADSITPVGILGPPEEKEYWSLYEAMIQIAILQDDMDEAIDLMDKFEEGRRAVNLKTMPDNDLQEAILGYLAQKNEDLAKTRLQHWIDTTRIRTISPMVSAHPLFKKLCLGVRWNTQ